MVAIAVKITCKQVLQQFLDLILIYTIILFLTDIKLHFNYNIKMK
jgi:hypothetical protein